MKNKIIVIFGIFAFFATSCNDWLDVRPDTEVAADVMFDSYEGYKDALTGCYIKLKSRTLYGENLTMSAVEYLAQHWRFNDSQNINATADALKNHMYRDDNARDVTDAIYKDLYNVIVQANTIINALPETGLSAIENNQARGVVEGEAYALRALCHFEVLRLFGQVPEGTTQVRLPYQKNVSRENIRYSDWAEFIALLESDLKKAEDLLKEHDPLVELTVSDASGNKVTDEYLRYRQIRLNYYAVKALQARFYLYIGGRTADAHAAAREVIDASIDRKGFRLATSEDFNGSREYQLYAAPDEGLFILSNHQLKNYITSIFGRVVGGTNHAWQVYLSPEDLAGPGMFEEPRTTSTDIRFRYLWSFGQNNSQGEEICQIKKYYQLDDNSLGASALMLRKQIVPLLRLSEMYFIVMETSGDMDEINDLYERFRVSRGRDKIEFTDKAEVFEMLGKEYRRELIAEGQMFYWYKRHRSTTMLWSDRVFTEASYIVPLPASEYDPNI